MLNEDQDDRIKDAHAHLEQALQIMSAQDLLLAQSRKQLDLKSPRFAVCSCLLRCRESPDPHSKVFTSHTQKNLNELIEDGEMDATTVLTPPDCSGRSRVAAHVAGQHEATGDSPLHRQLG
eukprot:409082-Hanusia_phi.AAC.1